MKTDSGLEKAKKELSARIRYMGYPAEFAEVLAMNLRTEKMIRRMCAYLREAHPRSAEEIADEMMAICSDRDAWTAKKEAQYYNAKMNEWIRSQSLSEDAGEDTDSPDTEKEEGTEC